MKYAPTLLNPQQPRIPSQAAPDPLALFSPHTCTQGRNEGKGQEGHDSPGAKSLWGRQTYFFLRTPSNLVKPLIASLAVCLKTTKNACNIVFYR